MTAPSCTPARKNDEANRDASSAVDDAARDRIPIGDSGGPDGATGGAAAIQGDAGTGGASGMGGTADLTGQGGSESRGGAGSGDSGGSSGGSGGGGRGGSGGAAGNSGTGSSGNSGTGSSGSSGRGGDIGAIGSGRTAGNGASGVGPPTRVSITASAAASAMGRGVNLGQMFENTQHPQTFAAARAKIDAYFAKGFRNLRIPVTWTEVTNGSMLVNNPAVGDVNRGHPRLSVIAQVIDYALSKPNLYVVLNAHHEDALKDGSRTAALERLWTDLVDLFKNRDYRLMFEILNEPHRIDGSAMPAADLRTMTSRAYARIRAADPQRIVLIGGNRYFSAAEVPEVWTTLSGVGGGQDRYVMATYHHYSPWTFCGDNQGSYDDPWTDANISGPMDTMVNWARSVGRGMPVYLGEWGVGWGSRYSTLTCNNIRLWYQKMHTEFAAPRGIPTAVWDDGGWFKVFDHTTNSYANNLADCIVGNCTWTGTDRFNDGCN